jgi:hypothetical protein
MTLDLSRESGHPPMVTHGTADHSRAVFRQMRHRRVRGHPPPLGGQTRRRSVCLFEVHGGTGFGPRLADARFRRRCNRLAPAGDVIGSRLSAWVIAYVGPGLSISNRTLRRISDAVSRPMGPVE